MKNIYLVKKNPEMEVANDNWIVMNAYEFALFLKTPDGQRRKSDFGKLPNSSESDYTIYAECGSENAKAWKQERNRHIYVEQQKENLGVSIFSYNSIEINDEEISGEELIVDPDCDVELYVVKKIEKEVLHKAIEQLSEYDRVLIYSFFFLDKPMTEKEFSEKYNINRRTVSYHKERALQRLKKILQNQK